MRKLNRPQEPEFMREKSAEWNQRWSDRRNEKPNAPFSWYQHDKKTVRELLLPILREMNQGHCMFCDSYPLEGSSKEPIEHFRPKSDPRFYHLAYEWTNLYYSCEACQNSKREQWDEKLIPPDEDQYRFHEFFVFDYSSGAIRENPLASPDKQDRAKCTIMLYDLDSDARRRLRREFFFKWSKTKKDDLDSWPFRDYLESVKSYNDMKL